MPNKNFFRKTNNIAFVYSSFLHCGNLNFFEKSTIVFAVQNVIKIFGADQRLQESVIIGPKLGP